MQALAVDSQAPDTVYAGTQFGEVFVSHDGNANWSALNAGLAALDVRALAFDPHAPGALYAGTTTGVYRGFVPNKNIHLPVIRR